MSSAYIDVVAESGGSRMTIAARTVVGRFATWKVMWIEASCRFHEVHLQHLGSWYHCLNKLSLVSLDVL